MKLLVVGNCQAGILGSLFEAMLSNADVAHSRLLPPAIVQMNAGTLDVTKLRVDDSGIGDFVLSSDLILIPRIAKLVDKFAAAYPSKVGNFRMTPRISFSGFHPDMVNLDKAPYSPTGGLHSSIVCFGWKNGLSEDETISLFKEDVFEELGFFDYWRTSVNFLLQEFESIGLPMEDHVSKWTAQGAWMHSFNHPKLHVLADIARGILRREGISFLSDVELQMTDPLARQAAWSTYPEIASRIGVPGGYEFRKGGGLAPGASLPHSLDLEQFVLGSFRCYAGQGKEAFACERLSSSRYQQLGRFVRASGRRSAGTAERSEEPRKATASVTTNPYQTLPDHQFWRRAIERTPMAEVDPVVRSSFALERSDKVATAGSCFAQHIARTLVKNGFNYYIPERADDLESEEAERRNFGVFSARFGNLYTTRQLLQLFDRAYGNFRPMENVWVRSDGRLVDPFRPQIEPEGFATVEELERSRAEHFAAVREMFETLDVFVFTLGLTEAWRNRIDGAVYPLAPGVVAGEVVADKHEFVNFSAVEVTADLQGFVGRLRSVNPQAKIILTVSPVPLIATYEDRHVLVATTDSKSVLRVAAEEICQRNPLCAYFPSFEIITGNFAKSEYFESDLRSVTPQGVDHVMRLFMKHYGSKPSAGSLDDELMRENAAVAEVVCDEEAIDA